MALAYETRPFFLQVNHKHSSKRVCLTVLEGHRQLSAIHIICDTFWLPSPVWHFVTLFNTHTHTKVSHKIWTVPYTDKFIRPFQCIKGKSKNTRVILNSWYPISVSRHFFPRSSSWPHAERPQPHQVLVRLGLLRSQVLGQIDPLLAHEEAQGRSNGLETLLSVRWLNWST